MKLGFRLAAFRKYFPSLQFLIVQSRVQKKCENFRLAHLLPLPIANPKSLDSN